MGLALEPAAGGTVVLVDEGPRRGSLARGREVARARRGRLAGGLGTAGYGRGEAAHGGQDQAGGAEDFMAFGGKPARVFPGRLVVGQQVGQLVPGHLGEEAGQDAQGVGDVAPLPAAFQVLVEVGVGVEPETPGGQVADEVAALPGRGRRSAAMQAQSRENSSAMGKTLRILSSVAYLRFRALTRLRIWDMVYMVVLSSHEFNPRRTRRGTKGSFIHEWALMFTNGREVSAREARGWCQWGWGCWSGVSRGRLGGFFFFQFFLIELCWV